MSPCRPPARSHSGDSRASRGTALRSARCTLAQAGQSEPLADHRSRGTAGLLRRTRCTLPQGPPLSAGDSFPRTQRPLVDVACGCPLWPLAILDYSRGGFLDWTTFRVEDEDEREPQLQSLARLTRSSSLRKSPYLYLVPINRYWPNTAHDASRDPDVTCYDDGDGCCFI